MEPHQEGPGLCLRADARAVPGDTAATLTRPARCPWRDRPIEESLDLFERMKNGEFPEGKYTLRAKIDLASGNFNMRDPVLYRIRYIEHHRQGTKWCIFPMYDFAHPIQDALEGITHSLCSLEYEDHRPAVRLGGRTTPIVPAKPRQIEFARLGIDHTVMSKRKLRQLVEERLRLRLGRPPYAHPLRPAPPGLHPRIHPQLLRAHRRGQDHLHRGVRLPGALPARGPQRAPPSASWPCCAPSSSPSPTIPRVRARPSRWRTTPTDPEAGTREVTFSRHAL